MGMLLFLSSSKQKGREIRGGVPGQARSSGTERKETTPTEREAVGWAETWALCLMSFGTIRPAPFPSPACWTLPAFFSPPAHSTAVGW
jgi:hypothetical protein